MKKVLLVPGLNMHPSALNDLSLACIKECHNVFIHQHRYGNIPNTWKDDFRETLALFRPDIIIAHSLGTLLSLDAFYQKIIDCPMILICSPLVLGKSSEYFLKIIKHLPFNIKIPSLNLSDYRVNSYTKAFDYQIFFKLMEKVKNNFEASPQLIFVYVKKDELVDSQKSHLLTGGHLFSKKTLGPHHLFINRSTMGEENYSHILEILRQMLTS